MIPYSIKVQEINFALLVVRNFFMAPPDVWVDFWGLKHGCAVTQSLYFNYSNVLPYYNANVSGLTLIGPLLWQALFQLCQLKPAT